MSDGAAVSADIEHAYADALHADFDEAARTLGLRRAGFELAGHALHVEFAGDALADRLAPAFAHLAPADGATPPELTIQAWDRASAGRAAPAPPWDVTRYAPLQRVRGLDPHRLRASYDLGPGCLSLYRPRSGRAAFYAADAAAVPRWVARMPFRHLLGWWAEEVGLTFAHTAAVGRDGACLLLPGPSGSGKSTTALAAAEHGLDFLADDICLVDVDVLRAHAPYGWAKAEADAVARIPSLAARIVDTEEGQSMLRPRHLVRSARIVGIALPRVTGRPRSAVRPATAGEAMFALGPSTLVEGNGAGQRSLARLAQLARAVPVVHLDLGVDMVDNVATLDQLLARVSR